MTAIELFNRMRADASLDFQSRVPELTQQNLAEVGDLLGNLEYSTLGNEFGGMVGKIALTIFTSCMYQNPLAKFKKGKLPLGESVEEIFFNLAKGYTFDKEGTNPLARALPKAITTYHSKEFKHTYNITLQRVEIINAFRSEGDLDNFFTKSIESLYSAYNYDEFLIMKNLILEEIPNATMFAVPLPKDDATAKDFVRELKTQVIKNEFMNTNNPLKVQNHTPRQNMVLFIDSKVYSRISTDVLASAFNMGQVDYMTKIFVLDDFENVASELSEFTHLDETKGTGKPYAILLDERSIQVYEKYLFLDKQHNAKGSFDTYYLQVGELIGFSKVGTLVAFIDYDSGKVGERICYVDTPSDTSNTILAFVSCGEVGGDLPYYVNCKSWYLDNNLSAFITLYKNGTLVSNGSTVNMVIHCASGNYNATALTDSDGRIETDTFSYTGSTPSDFGLGITITSIS